MSLTCRPIINEFIEEIIRKINKKEEELPKMRITNIEEKIKRKF